MNPASTLPKEFVDLERFLPWALPTSGERQDRRHVSSMEEIREFYDVLVARMPEILAKLGEYQNEDSAPPDVRTLHYMTLSLAEVATCVEWFGQPSVIHGFDYRRYQLVEH